MELCFWIGLWFLALELQVLILNTWVLITSVVVGSVACFSTMHWNRVMKQSQRDCFDLYWTIHLHIGYVTAQLCCLVTDWLVVSHENNLRRTVSVDDDQRTMISSNKNRSLQLPTRCCVARFIRKKRSFHCVQLVVAPVQDIGIPNQKRESLSAEKLHMDVSIPGQSVSESECPDVKNCKRWLNPVWHRILYGRTRMATVGVKG